MKELLLIRKIHRQAFSKVIKKAKKSFAKTYSLDRKSRQIIEQEIRLLEDKFFGSLKQSLTLARLSKKEKYVDYRRLSGQNPAMGRLKQRLLQVFPHTANVWVLDGLVFSRQSAGLKFLAGVQPDSAAVIDVLNSAASLNLGAQNPWLIQADRHEDHLGLKDNFCTAYHAGIRHLFALESLKKLHPNYPKQKNFSVHMESSGTIVDSVAIESAVSFAEKSQPGKIKKVLAVDGTWCGGYGTAREATGFGVDRQQAQRAGSSLWVERILPKPIKTNSARFLQILKKKIKDETCAGLYLEPDVIGDLGMIVPDSPTLHRAVKLLKQAKLPIILDCVQQLGRSGSYWGENVDSVFKGYPWLIMTTAKSASNGQPFGFVVMPKEIMTAAQPFSQITTNQMNGPLLRSLVVANIFSQPEFQKWIKQKSDQIETVAIKYGFPLGETGLRGKYLNRGIYVGDNEMVKLVQIALLVENGILVGALPQTIRYQPMLLELCATNKLVAEIIFSKIRQIQGGKITKQVKKIHQQMSQVVSGLARKNK